MLRHALMEADRTHNRKHGTLVEKDKACPGSDGGRHKWRACKALAAAKLGIPVGHVEAGLRSFDLRMPEEHNRRLTNHLSTYLFAPKNAENDLKRESVWEKIYVIGNTVIDAVAQHIQAAERKSRILEKVSFSGFALATIHRAENETTRLF